MKRNKLLTFGILGILILGLMGMAAQFTMSLLRITTTPTMSVGSVFIAFLVLLFVVLIIEIVSAFKIDDSTFHTALIAVCLLFLYSFSTDTQLFLSIFGIHVSNITFGILSEISFIFAASSCCYYIVFLYNLRINKNKVVILAATIFSLFIGYSFTIKYKLAYIFHIILFCIIVIMFCSLLYKAEKKSKIGTTTYFSTTLFCLSVGIQNVNMLSYNEILMPVLGLSLAYIICTISMFATVYLIFTIRSDSKAVKSNEYKLQAESFKNKALSSQIKPHFIFNSLETIRALYHVNTAEGDKAMNLLSELLRGSINSFDCDLIPFETELDNIYNYAEFKNLKRSNKIEVIFNIDYTDFFVPPFSIQPFVENAIKYSGVDEIEKGCIIISSYKQDNFAIVEIVDNGKGFDITKISDSSHGIKNACGRFSLALGILPEIKSTIGQGTRVTIKIDLTKEKGNKK